MLMREGDVFAGHYGNRLSAPGLYVANIAFTLLSPYCQLSTRSLLHFLISILALVYCTHIVQYLQISGRSSSISLILDIIYDVFHYRPSSSEEQTHPLSAMVS